MQELQHFKDLARPTQHLVFRDTLPLTKLVEMGLKIAPGDIFHDEVMPPALAEVVDYLRNTRMGELGEHARLAVEILDRFLFLDTPAEDHLLGGDRPVRQTRVVGEIHTSHPTLA